MSKENEKTLEVYEQTASTYLANSLEHDQANPMKAKEKQEKLFCFLKDSFSSLPPNAKILEIGAADGVNAKYLESLGYRVVASDIALAFLNEIHNKGLQAVKFNVLEDDFSEKYFGVFCWRVFVHFTKEDIIKAINKIYDALEENGIFVFNVMNREGKSVACEWLDLGGDYHMGKERFYQYYYADELDKIIQDTDFQVINSFGEGGKDNNKWLVRVLKK